MSPTAPSSLRSAVSTAATLLAGLCWIAVEAARTGLELLFSLARRSWTAVASAGAVIARRTDALLRGPVRDALTGPVRRGLLGRRLDVSAVVVLLAPVVAIATAWWVGSTVGYHTLEQWVRGTWTGTDPALLVFVAVGALLALAALCAALNDGLLPTVVLSSAPVVGATVTRYGTDAAYWGTDVVSLPEAVTIAALVGLAVGVPVAVVGSLVGVTLRRVAGVLGRPPGGLSRPEES
ncbi:hypothetical protein [Haloarcula litorea]|uniref:hypothetical protein n=1 Tax=Haloarcula litorea TaxID=3032579 RepID=UPI0023E88988|nr:hypothetical protein [Halomicroarcula sp. GDY20]